MPDRRALPPGMTPRRPYTVESAAEYLGCSPSHVRNLCARGELRYFKLGRLIRIPAAAIEEFSATLPGGKFPSPPPRAPRQPKPVPQIRQIRRALGRLPQSEVQSFVYFIQAESGGLIKIGVSIDPLVRLVSLQAGSPLKLVILGCVRGGRMVERAIHRAFSADRRHFEWFEPSPMLVEFIAETLSAESVPRGEYEKAVLYRSASARALVEGKDG